MKQLLFAILIASSLTASSQTHSLKRLWKTDTVIAIPESVLADKNILYVSLIDGAPWDADGKGGIAKLSTTGEVINARWITGLHAPKGLGRLGNKLYVADMDKVVVIDINKGRIIKKIKIETAEGLNDITVSPGGIVYVSDSKKGTVWRIAKDAPALYLENLNGINGLKAVKNELYIASGKSFVKANAQKQITPIAELPQGGDGVEPIGNGDFIVTAWGGWVFYVTAKGKVETIMETTAEKKNTADIGYDPIKRIVYIPTFNAKTVEAYRLN